MFIKWGWGRLEVSIMFGGCHPMYQATISRSHLSLGSTSVVAPLTGARSNHMVPAFKRAGNHAPRIGLFKGFWSKLHTISRVDLCPGP